MPYYRRVGDVPAKRHLRVTPEGGGALLAEELMGAHGFTEESALLYHRHSPSAIVAATSAEDPSGTELSFDDPMLPRHLRTPLVGAAGDPVLGRTRLLGNADVVISWVDAVADSALYRSALGDELFYVHRGDAVLDTSFGSLPVRRGDYVVIPTGTTHRWRLGAHGLAALVLETRGHLTFPARYLSSRGQLVEGAPFSERDIRGPDSPHVEEGTDVPVLVRTRAGLTRHVHARHPFDVVGWDGCLYPFALSIFDFEPIVGSIHQPPPVHQTFAGPSLVVCSFVPRPYDFHPGAIKVPYHHANVHSDEVLFYSDGDFMSRRGSGIGVGSISLHPAGFVHGPQPGSMEYAADQSATDELAVMVDTFARLAVSDEARRISDDSYPWSWATGRGAGN
ncbi:MAG: homogentisate 1,2-dioxygenase [Acidimicrobiales bacterium]